MADTLKNLSQRAKRFYFVIGIGFTALVVGSIFSVVLLQRLGPRLAELPFAVVLPIELVLRNLWSLAILPLFGYGAARVVPISSWSTALGALATGELFVRVLRYVQGGTDAIWSSGLDFGTWLVVVVASAWLTRTAIVKALAAATVTELASQAKAQAKVSEYAAFAEAAERQASRNEQAELARAAGQLSASVAQLPEAAQDGEAQVPSMPAASELGATEAAAATDVATTDVAAIDAAAATDVAATDVSDAGGALD